MWKIIYTDATIKKIAAWDPDLRAQIHGSLEARDWHEFGDKAKWMRFVTPYTPQRSFRVLCRVVHSKSCVNVLDINMERL